VRNAEDGKAVGCGNPVAWTPQVDVAKRERNPKGGALRWEAQGRQAAAGLWRGDKLVGG